VRKLAVEVLDALLVERLLSQEHSAALEEAKQKGVGESDDERD